MSVIRVWKYDRVWSAHINISYSAVLQQITRHRSFEFSVESSRAKELELNFMPDWMSKGEGRMFSQTEPNPFQTVGFTLVWESLKHINRLGSWLLKVQGAHKQHYNLPTKPWATVDCIMTGSPYAWDSFFALRASMKDGAQSDIVNVAQELQDLFHSTEEEETEYGLIYGPYLDEPIELTNINELVLSDTDHYYPLRAAITSVGRTSTGNTGNIPARDSSYRFVKRAYDQKHSSVFGHHWTPTPRLDARYGPLAGAMSVRNLLSL